MDTNDQQTDGAQTQDKGTTEQPVQKVEQKQQESTDYRPKLSDEEQLAILEGRAKRLKTKLGLSDEAPKPDASNDLLEKSFLRAAGLTHAEDVELARSTAKKWNMSLDQVVDDEDFKVKLERLQTKRSNDLATSDVKGDGAGTGASAKNTPEYWLAKGVPPNPAEVTDYKVRAKIMRAFVTKNKGIGDNPYYSGK